MTADNSAQRPRARDIGDILTLGFGTATAMWAAGYISHMPKAVVPAPLVFALLVCLLFAGGFLAGRWTARSVWGGVWTGVTAALINVLILGSVMRDVAGETENLMRFAPLWVLGSSLLSAIVAAFGAALGAKKARPVPGEQWAFRFCVVAASATLLLLFAGGLVTSNRVGLAVPDWPSTYGSNMFLYPLSKMTGGIYFEHAHRLLGTLVGLIAIVLAIYLQRTQRPGYVKVLAWLTLLAVIVQGIFGGVRVTENEIVLAIVHGVLGQGVFVMFVALATLTSPSWATTPATSPRANADKRLTKWLVALVILQIALGSLLRHVDFSWHLHATMAAAILAVAMIASIRVSTGYSATKVLRRAANGVMHAVGAQFVLGFGTLMPHLSAAQAGLLVSPLPGAASQPLPLVYVILATAHQILGAIVFAQAARLMLLTAHLAVQDEERD